MTQPVTDDEYYGIEYPARTHVRASDHRGIGRILWQAAEGDITKQMAAALVFSQHDDCWISFRELAKKLPNGIELLCWAAQVLYSYPQDGCMCLKTTVREYLSDYLSAEELQTDDEEVPF